jgi:hypothetical protein
MADNGNFIAKATAGAHGQFAAKAKKAGMSTAAYASKMKKGNSVTAKQARLATTLMKLNKGKKAKAPAMDAEDKIDGGADEATEKD